MCLALVEIILMALLHFSVIELIPSCFGTKILRCCHELIWRTILLWNSTLNCKFCILSTWPFWKSLQKNPHFSGRRSDPCRPIAGSFRARSVIGYAIKLYIHINIYSRTSNTAEANILFCIVLNQDIYNQSIYMISYYMFHVWVCVYVCPHTIRFQGKSLHRQSDQ